MIYTVIESINLKKLKLLTNDLFEIKHKHIIENILVSKFDILKKMFCILYIHF